MPNFSKNKTSEKQFYVSAEVLLSSKNNIGKIKTLEEMCDRVGKLKHYLWDKYGSFNSWNLDVIDTEKKIRKSKEFDLVQEITGGITGKLFTKNTYTCLKDIVMYQEACKEKLIKVIYKRYTDKDIRKELCKLLNKGNSSEIVKNNWLHKEIRKVFYRGRTWKSNQFVLSKEQYNLKEDNKGNQWLAISTLDKRSRVKLLIKGNIVLNSEIRIINKNNKWYCQYSKVKSVINDSERLEEVGVDRGYTEVFATSDNEMLGQGLGNCISDRQGKLDNKIKKRNKLFALRKKYLAQKKNKKANNISRHNLGKQKLNNVKEKSKNQIKNIITKSCQDLCKKYKNIIYEDLTTPIDNNKPFRKPTKNKLAHWTKGEVIKWLSHIAKLRGSQLTAVNPAYTSQICSLTKCLTGIRKGDKFYRHNGEVVQADYNAALNILNRKLDKNISLYTPYRKVKEILLARTEEYLQCDKDCTKTLDIYQEGLPLVPENQSVSELA